MVKKPRWQEHRSRVFCSQCCMWKARVKHARQTRRAAVRSQANARAARQRSASALAAAGHAARASHRISRPTVPSDLSPRAASPRSHGRRSVTKCTRPPPNAIEGAR